MYGKIFRQMYKGTLASHGPWEALVTFQQMIVLADRSGVVDMTADALSRETTIPLDIILKGIAALEQPDPDSRTPGEDGRRIVRLSESRSWGWQIVNYSYYRNLKSEEERAEYHRQYYKEKRSKAAKALNNNLNTSQQSQTSTNDSSHAEAEALSRGIKQEAEEIRKSAREDVEIQQPQQSQQQSTSQPSSTRLSSKELEGFWWSFRGAYPAGTYHPSEWLAAEKRFNRLVDELGIAPQELWNSAKAYYDQQAAKAGIGTQFVKSPARFLENDYWRGPFHLPVTKQKPPRVRLRTADEIEADEAREAAERGN